MFSVKCVGLGNVFAKTYSSQLKSQIETATIKLRSIVEVRVRYCTVSENYQKPHMGNYWLLKTEPDCWSWDNQTANKGLSVWDGVRNHQAQKAMRNMVEDDLCFFYHTGKLKEVCGIVRVVKTFYPDPTDETGKWGAVDVREVKLMKSKVTLAQMKEDDEIADFLMFRQPRLSVVPVEEKVWRRVCNMGEVEPLLLDSSDNLQEHASNGKFSENSKGAESAKQEAKKKKSVRGKKKGAEGRVNQEESNSVKTRISKSKAAPTVKEDTGNITAAKKASSAKSKTGVSGKDGLKAGPPVEVVKKRRSLSDSDSYGDEQVLSAITTKKRASESKPARPIKRPTKKQKKGD